ncbi:MAG: deoxynucleoside kinase [bacterium]|nr:deoxynucleoside kinase [bacterium]
MVKKFIVFEGVDGSGKSEISKIVSDMLDTDYLESPTLEFKSIRKYIDDYSSPIGRFLFYMTTNLDLSRIIEEKVKYRDVICARYYYSTLIGYSARSGKSLNYLMKKLPTSNKDFYQADLTILLYVNRNEQKNRINKRNNGVNSGSDERCLYDENYGKDLAKKYLMVAKKLNWLIIDTSNMTMDEVVKECILNIKAMNPVIATELN